VIPNLRETKEGPRKRHILDMSSRIGVKKGVVSGRIKKSRVRRLLQGQRFLFGMRTVLTGGVAQHPPIPGPPPESLSEVQNKIL